MSARRCRNQANTSTWQDMTNTDEARRAVKETIEQLGGIDIVLANAVCRR